MADPEAALAGALERQDLALVYQPIHEIASGRIIACEALLRQMRQSGELREAGLITATAEKGPDLYLLDSWVIQTAVREATKWKTIHEGLQLSINISPREFEGGHILKHIDDLLQICAIDPRDLVLEITETSYIKRPKDTIDVLQQLKDMGFSLWLDDFGTGHSSITYLQHFPLDALKIAGTFIKGMIDDSRCEAITESLIALAHRLGLKAIAEEVENEAQLEGLRTMGCDAIQGFLLSEPMMIEDLGPFLRQSS